ncbi:EamA family transporter [Polaribacter vadi]|uniref:EamA family transporter n=1 Tax=Polaribacter TaxID=52959 RepID=UPI001C091E9D|nr:MULTISPECIES: EamA family transporter [Polaribacter]MBU3012105.1 EamA family transporter [Polaribacter vadi]MDO6741921.1 EamA family transporter [Polaribacter sp. 1_MG-2023]
MIYLLLSILFSTGLFVIFKYFGIFKVDVLKAIFINYIVAFIMGFALTESSFTFSELPNKPWFIGATCLGALFVSIFFVMAMTAQRNGVSVTSVAGKMSVVIPVFFGVFLYNESVTVLKIAGIIIALIAVYLASVKEKSTASKNAGLLFPVLLFLGSGAIDTILKFIESNYVTNDDVSIFSGSLFGIAATFAAIVLIIKSIKKREAFGLKNVIAGIVLGIPNYFSIVFLIKALQTEGFESSTLFTINNVAIVIVSTIVGILVFKEQFSIKNKIGVALAILGIVIVALA